MKRAHLDDLPDGHTIFIGTQPVKLPVEPVSKFIALVASLAIALVSAATLTSEWQTLALFWYAPHTSEVIDPIFGKPVNFYLFALPAWEIVVGWLLTLAVILCLVAVFFLFVSGGARMLAGRLSRQVILPWRGFSIAFGFLLLILAANTYLSRFDRLLSDHTIFGGVTYTDAHVSLMGLLVVSRCPRCWRFDGLRQRPARTPRVMVDRVGCAGSGLLYRFPGNCLVCGQLYREAQ